MTDANSFKRYDSGVEPREDAVLRAKAALEGITDGPWEVSRWEYFGGSPSYYIEDIEQFRGYRNSVNFGSDAALAEFVAASRSLIPELVAEVERLRAHIAAMPSAIQAYADGELTAISYVSAHPSLTNAELVAFTAEKDTLLRFQRDAESIVAYAATAVQS